MARRPLPADLPDEVRELIEPHLDPDVDRLRQIGLVIAEKRQDAIAARIESGLERVWTAAEEAYVGIDDANRAEFGEGRWSKPMSSDGPLTREGSTRTDARSTVYVRLTARYVDAGAAKVGEILLPPDDKAFSFDATPVPEFAEFRNNPKRIVGDNGEPLYRPAKPEEMAPEEQPSGPLNLDLNALNQPAANPAVPSPAPGTTSPPSAPGPAVMPAPVGGAVPSAGAAAALAGMMGGQGAAPGGPPPGQVPLTTKDIADEQMELARDKAKKAEKRVYDWMVESQYPAEMRKVIFDAARIGVGVLKGPFPKARRNMVLSKAKGQDGQAEGYDLEIRRTVKPAVKWVDPWNFFPDPACGEDINNGQYAFERDHFSERQVRNLKDEPGYIAAQIDKVLDEGPGGSRKTDSTEKPGGISSDSRKKNQYEVWHFTGTLSSEDMACILHAAGSPLTKEERSRKDVYAVVTIINDHVVKAAFNMLEKSGSLGYHAVPWQRRTGSWAGIGIAEQVATPQRMINAATRALLNNAGKSAGSQIVVNRDGIEPANGNWQIEPDKIWYLLPDANMTVDQAFGMFQVPAVTQELMAIIEYALRLAEESTNIPLVTQGQSGPTQPETYGAMQLQNNNANQLLRSIGYAFDDFVTEPVVREYYEWLMLDPEVPEDEKGDFDINARGSAALVERAIQDQSLAQMGAMVLNPAYKMDPAKWAVEFVKSKRFDPRAFTRSEEEQAKLDAAPPPAAPQVEVAKINAASREKIAQAMGGVAQAKAGVEAQIRLRELAVRERLALTEYANRRGISLENVKAQLARTTMQLDTQVKLATARIPATGRSPARRSPQVARAPMEPVGRAAPGRAFEQ